MAKNLTTNILGLALYSIHLSSFLSLIALILLDLATLIYIGMSHYPTKIIGLGNLLLCNLFLSFLGNFFGWFLICLCFLGRRIIRCRFFSILRSNKFRSQCFSLFIT